MINLLSEIQKEKLKEEKEKRILFHWLILILFFSLSLSLFLLNLKIFLSEKIKKEKLDLENQEKILKLETKKEILETNKLISKLLNFPLPFVQFLEEKAKELNVKIKEGPNLSQIQKLKEKEFGFLSFSISVSGEKGNCFYF
jgi:hypothetical protein